MDRHFASCILESSNELVLCCGRELVIVFRRSSNRSRSKLCCSVHSICCGARVALNTANKEGWKKELMVVDWIGDW